METINSGIKKWKDITKEDLIDLSYKQGLADSIIADMYGIKKSAVTYKRNKMGLKIGYAFPEYRKFCEGETIKAIQRSYLPLKAKKEYVEIIKKSFKMLEK